MCLLRGIHADYPRRRVPAQRTYMAVGQRDGSRPEGPFLTSTAPYGTLAQSGNYRVLLSVFAEVTTQSHRSDARKGGLILAVGAL